MISLAYLRSHYIYSVSNGFLISRKLNRPVGRLKNGYLVIDIKKKTYPVHRIIYFMQHGLWPDRVDHRNRIRHDNRWVNLRSCSDAENAQNRGIQRNNDSGCPGVYYRRDTGKWVAQIGVDNRRIPV